MANEREADKPIRVEARGPKNPLTIQQFVTTIALTVALFVFVVGGYLSWRLDQQSVDMEQAFYDLGESIELALGPFQIPLSYAMGLGKYPDGNPLIVENINWMDRSLNAVSPKLAVRYINHFVLETGESISLQALLEADGAKILFDLPVDWNQRTQEARVLVVSIPDVWRFAGVELVDMERGCAAKPLRFPGVTPSKRLYVCLGDAGFMNILVITAS